MIILNLLKCWSNKLLLQNIYREREQKYKIRKQKVLKDKNMQRKV